MRILLDTQVLIWSILRPHRLKVPALQTIRDRSNDVLFSAASIWEVAIKRALQRPDFNVDPAHLASTARLDFVELPVTVRATIKVTDLPMHHRDPFDRLLVAQAIDEGATFLTSDAALAAYGSHIVLVR